ncbi:glycosyltransferase family 4 protein [Acidobacteria bacterium AH-259-O06]|nr:glycosyltransferase family 4 protein [Acidobacteria bacterium AH-259-O06]
MKILFIAPVPPPITGHALAAKVFLDELTIGHKVDVINLNKDSLKDGEVSFKRIAEVAKIFMDVWRNRKDADIIYFTISESFAGNIKDLFIYLICFKSLSKMYIHLHGGSIGKLLFDRHRILSGINKIFIKRLAGVIISGESHRNIFESMIPKNIIHVAPNFAQDYLFLTEREIIEKFSNNKTLRILFIGNLIQKKGYNEIIDAFFKLDDKFKSMVRIDFAGRFESESQRTIFLDKIIGVEQIRYHGVVDDVEKKSLFSQAHAFCLPTCFLEGQPVSILEAYASGCVVITTGQSGIRDIFTDGLNGFEVQERSPDSLKVVLEKIIEKPENLIKIAISNRTIAGEKYRTSSYTSTLSAIIESASGIPPLVIPRD